MSAEAAAAPEAAGQPQRASGVRLDAGIACVDFISDLHLQPADEATALAFEHYVAHTPAQAIAILGDLFEVWVGDDALEGSDPSSAFERRMAAALKAAASTRWLGLMHGNRDFLLGRTFAAATGAQPLADPTLLEACGQRLLLTHGDAWVLADTDYLALRARLRASAWQQGFLAQPLQTRRAQAAQMRAQSEAHHAEQRAQGATYADVDEALASRWLAANDAPQLIHGHTHRPAAHALPGAGMRHVLSDWHAGAQPPRGDVLRLTARGIERVTLA